MDGQSQLYHSKKSKKRTSTGLSMFLFLLKAIGVLAFCAFAFSAYVSGTRSFGVDLRLMR
jgi:hypothetical protein